MTRKQTVLALAGVLALIVAGFASPMAGAMTAAGAENSELNWDDPKAPNAYGYESKVKISEHNLSEMDSALDYYGDNGDVKTLPASLNESINNSLGWRADKIDASVLSKFPRSSTAASALDPGEWTAGSNISVTDTDGATASGVESIKLKTDGTLGSGGSTTASYSNFSITTDPGKRVPLLIGNVESIESGTEVTVSYVDADGDAKHAYINSSLTASDANVIATQTANGVVWQQRLADLSTDGSNGDGSFDGIEKIKVNVSGGDATVTLTGIDVERKSQLTLGEKNVQKDDDSELETKTIYEISDGGVQRYASLASMDSALSSASVHDLYVYGLKYQTSTRDGGDVKATVEEQSDYGGYSHHVEVFSRITIPSAIDVTHYGLEMRLNQSSVSDRYTALRMKEQAGTTDFSDISSWTDKSGKLTEKNTLLVLDTTIQPGTSTVIEVDVLATSEEAKALMPNTGGGDGGGGQTTTSNNWGLGIIGGLIAALLGLMGRDNG